MRSREQKPQTNGGRQTPGSPASGEQAQADAPAQKRCVRAFEPPPWPLGLTISAASAMTCSVPRDLAVILTPAAFTQLFGYAYATSLEISCLGVVRRDGARFRIERFCLVKQKCSTGHTELDPEAVAAVVEELRDEGKIEELTALKCWAHSHPNLGLFWSKTDDDTCTRLVSDWLVSLVVSNDFAIRCRIDVGGAVPFTIDQVPVLMATPADEAILADLRAQAGKLVTERLPLLSVLDGQNQAPQALGAEEFCDQCGSWHPAGKCLFDNWPLGEWEDEERAVGFRARARAVSVDPADSSLDEFEL